MSEDILSAINRGDFSEKEIRLAFSKISQEELAKQLDFFITFQGRGHTLRSLTRKWALSITPDYLGDKLEHLIKFQESEDEDVRSLSWDLADRISEDVLLENIFILLQYQAFDDEDVRMLTRDLALKIDPDKLIDKMELINDVCQESKNHEVCRLARKLIKNAKGSIKEENIERIIDLITS